MHSKRVRGFFKRVLLRGNNGTALISLRKAEDNGADALKVQSIKNPKSLPECPRSLRLLLPSTQKRSVTRNCWNRTWMAGTGLLIFAGKSTENVLAKYLTKQMTYVSRSFISVFSYLCSKTKHIPHMFVGVKSLKHNVRTTLQFSGDSRISKVGGHFWAKEKVGGKRKCLSCMGIFYVNQKNLNVNSRHNWAANGPPQISLRIATVAIRLPRL